MAERSFVCACKLLLFTQWSDVDQQSLSARWHALHTADLLSWPGAGVGAGLKSNPSQR